MANEFAPGELSEPGIAVPIQTPNPSPAAAIGEGLKGLASIFDVGLNHYHQDRINNITAELSKNWQPLIQSVAQGKMTSTALYAVASKDVSDAIAANPDLANPIREGAQGIIGINPSTAIVKDAADIQNLKAQAQAAHDVKLTQLAEASGMPSTVENGRLVENLQYLTERQKDLQAFAHTEAEIAALRRGTPVTHEDVVGQEFRTIFAPGKGGFQDYLQGQLSSLSEQYQAFLDKSAKSGANIDPNDVSTASAWYQSRKMAIESQLDNVLLGSSWDPDTIKKSQDFIKAALDKYDSIFSGPMSVVEQRLQAKKDMDAYFNLTFDKGSPEAAAFNAISPTAAGVIFATAAGADTEVGHSLDQSFQQGLRVVAKLKTPGGGYTDDPNEVKKTVETVSALADNAGKWNPNEPALWANGVQTVLKSAQKSDNPNDVAGVSDHVITPSNINALKVYSKNPDNVTTGQKIGNQFFLTANHNISLTGLSLKPQTVQSPVNLMGNIGAAAGYSGVGVPAASQGFQNASFTATPVYNSNTGKVEVQVTDAKGNVLSSSKSQPLIPKDMQTRVASVNNSLDSMEKLQSYGDDYSKQLTPQQLKYAAISDTRIPLKNGSPEIELPEAKQPEAPTTVTSDKNVDREIAITHKIESNNNQFAVNPTSGASGIGQTMKATLEDPGYGVTPAKDDSPKEKERVADDYFTAMVKTFGNFDIAHMAYNWGPDNVKSWLKSGADVSKVPVETLTYIGRAAIERSGKDFSSVPNEVQKLIGTREIINALINQQDEKQASLQ